MLRLRIILPVIAALAAWPADAAERSGDFGALIGKLIPGRCHMNYCGWISIENAGLVGASSKGELYKLDIKNWGAAYPDGNYNRPRAKKVEGASTSYVLCSKHGPAWLEQSEDKGSWIVTPLEPGNPDAIFGYNESVYAFYYGACHRAIVNQVYTEGTKLAHKLGYPFHATGDAAAPDDYTVKSPQDVL
jgi:hypothetical protein